MKTHACLARQLIGPNTPGKKGRNLNEFPEGKERLIRRQARGGGFPALKEGEGERGGDERIEKKKGVQFIPPEGPLLKQNNKSELRPPLA